MWNLGEYQDLFYILMGTGLEAYDSSYKPIMHGLVRAMAEHLYKIQNSWNFHSGDQEGN